MAPMHILLLLFILVPLGEIYLLIQVGGVIGALPTIGLVVLTALIGATLIRHQGLSTLARAQRSMDEGQLPATELLEGAVILVSGALLLTPGFITDAIGFACLVPRWRRHAVNKFIAARVEAATRQDRSGSSGRVIEGEYHRHDD
jgi:UPF0716 protein FxsA